MCATGLLSRLRLLPRYVLCTCSKPLDLGGRPLNLRPPSLQRLLPVAARSATFNVTFLDDAMRVTRGDRGELRVYIRDDEALGGMAKYLDPDSNTTFSSEGE
jgi:PAP_fibrillin